MKYFLLLPLALLMLLLCSCSTRYVEVMGEKFEMISVDEEKELDLRARSLLKSIEKKLPRGDYDKIARGEPQVQSIYTDHRFGRIIMRWDFPRYETGVIFEGQMMTEHMSSIVFTKEKQAEVVDFTRKKPRPSVFPGQKGKKENKKRRQKL